MAKKKKKGIKKFFLGIYRVIDRFIVTPISRLIFNVSEYFKNHNIRFDYILNRPHFMIYISLILAVIMFFLIDNKVISFVESEATLIPNIPVEVKYNEESYVVEGIPKSVDIILIGRKSDIYLAEQLGSNKVVLDLSDYKARDSAYKVYLSYTKSIDSIDYKLDPSYVSVTIKDKISVKKSFDYDLVNEQYLNAQFSVSGVTFKNNKNTVVNEVVVKGSEDAINSIDRIKALIDLNNPSLKAVGNYEIDNIPLVAYNSKGEILNNVEILSNTLKATVSIESFHREANIKVTTIGKLAPGKAIASIMINNNNSHSVTIYGDQEQIGDMGEIPITIKVDGLGASTKTIPVTLNEPAGVRAISEKNLNVTLTFGDEKQKEIQVKTIRPENLAPGLTANIIGTESVPVIVKGVQSEIDKVTSADAYINLEGLKAGDECDVEVKIKNDEATLDFVVSTTVRVKITQ